MASAVLFIRLASLGLVPLFAFGQSGQETSVKTTVCELARHPENFDGKLVAVRAMVDSGVEDLPSGLVDDTCGAHMKFVTPDDAHFAELLKSKGYRKLVKEVKKSPYVEAAVTGIFKRFGTELKPDNRFALMSVEEVTVRKPPRVP